MPDDRTFTAAQPAAPESVESKMLRLNRVNIAQKLKAGKTLSIAEVRELNEAGNFEATAGSLLSLHGLSHATGQSRDTIKRRLLAAGVDPRQRHRLADVLKHLRPKSKGGDADKLKFEQWRKLKIANDEAAGLLESKAARNAILLKFLQRERSVRIQKLEKEYPAALAGLDIPAAMIYGQRLNEEIDEIHRQLCDELGAEWKSLTT